MADGPNLLVKCPRPGCGREVSKKGLPRHAMSKHVRGHRCEDPGCTTPASWMNPKDGKIYCEGHKLYHQ